MQKNVIVSSTQPSSKLYSRNHVSTFLYRATERCPIVLPVIIEV